MFRIFVNLNFWVSVQMFTISLSRGLMEKVFTELRESDVNATGQSHTF